MLGLFVVQRAEERRSYYHYYQTSQWCDVVWCDIIVISGLHWPTYWQYQHQPELMPDSPPVRQPHASCIINGLKPWWNVKGRAGDRAGQEEAKFAFFSPADMEPLWFINVRLLSSRCLVYLITSSETLSRIIPEYCWSWALLWISHNIITLNWVRHDV